MVGAGPVETWCCGRVGGKYLVQCRADVKGD